jgi:hypothetical protein
MKSNSKRETTRPPIDAGRPFLSFLACAILFSVFAMPFPVNAGVSLTEMARFEARHPGKGDAGPHRCRHGHDQKNGCADQEREGSSSGGYGGEGRFTF